CGTGCRVLNPSDESPAFFAYRVGKGRNLRPGKAYVLSVDYPEDASRAMFLHNGGNETINGVATGTTTGDVLMGRYVNHNPESLHYPLSGKMQTWTGLFFLHDRFCGLVRPRGGGERPLTPEDGFWVIVSQSYGYLDPTSAGAAVAAIRLYEVEDESKLVAQIHYPLDDLPRRRLFWREEMADGVVHMGNRPEDRVETMRGVNNPVDWYEFKVKWARALGINTFCKDLLEFGHNQGWDSEPYGGNAWVYKPHHCGLWDEVVAMAAGYGMPILPYYEYYGSIGGDHSRALGPQKRAKRLSGGDKYTHIGWAERANVDLSDPDTLKDFEKILDLTVLKYQAGVPDKSGKTVHPEFLGAWLRSRPSNNPVSFNDRNLAEFSQSRGGTPVTRQQLQEEKELLHEYYGWWFDQRKAYLESVAEYLRAKNDPRSFVLFTAATSEPGWSIPSQLSGAGKKDTWKYKTVVFNDDPAYWDKRVEDARYAKRFVKAVPVLEALEGHWHPKALQAWQMDWGGWEVGHSCPPNDPANYADSKDLMLSYTIHRSYSADTDMDLFRTKAGLTAVRHFALNEHELNVQQADKQFEPTGYFIADVERAGPFCVMPEVSAVAKGDPTAIGYLTGNTFQRGFPRQVLAFNRAYLALPALPSRLIQAEKYGKEWVRKIDAGENRVWFAVCNLAFEPARIPVDGLPAGVLVDCSSGEQIPIRNGSATVSSEAMSLRSFRLQP
ncbi:MAG: hypothetical protein U1E05_07895, partial [Patescibacteria group bacterium]|nr:hypothetical protein [Patescibacteria group bacterium]